MIYSYIPIYTYIHTYTYVYTYIHAFMHTYLHTYIQTYIHTYIHTFMHTYLPTYLHTYIIIIIIFHRNCTYTCHTRIQYSHVWGEETVGDTNIVVTSTQDTNTTPYTTPFETWALFAQWSHGERVRSYFQTNNRSIFYFNSKQPSHTLGHKLSRFMRRSNVAGQWFG